MLRRHRFMIHVHTRTEKVSAHTPLLLHLIPRRNRPSGSGYPPKPSRGMGGVAMSGLLKYKAHRSCFVPMKDCGRLDLSLSILPCSAPSVRLARLSCMEDASSERFLRSGRCYPSLCLSFCPMRSATSCSGLFPFHAGWRLCQHLGVD